MSVDPDHIVPGPLNFLTQSKTLAPLSRREFLHKTTAASGFMLGLSLLGPSIGRADQTAAGLENAPGGDATPSLFINILADGTTEITCHRSEMGQQTWTAMAQIIADELEADWQKVKIVQALGDPKYGDQNTDGSRSVRYNLTRLRTTGAAMKQMLIEAAAQQWQVPVTECQAENGMIKHAGSSQQLNYGALASAAGQMKVPNLADVKLKSRDQWKYIGKAVASLTVPLITEGKGTFGIDVKVPDMLVAVIARPPQVFGSIKSVDDSQTLAVKGVVKTVRLPQLEPPALFKPLGGVAVIAKDTWSAIKGRRALQVDWEAGVNAVYDSVAFEKSMMETARKAGKVRMQRGDTTAALKAADKKVVAEYYAPHLSQSPMEPPMATARWNGDKVECWGCIQAPQAARRTVAQVCGVPEENVTIHVTLLGGGFGRKSKPDFFVEAALLARELKKPVKVVWTREDDLQQGYFHSVSAQRLEGGLNANGDCDAILHRTVFPTISSTFSTEANEPSYGELRLGASDNPFAVKNLQLESGSAPAHIRIGWLRSVCNVYHAFAVQSFAAELAAAAQQDPKDYLLKLIGEPRFVDPNQEGAEYDNYGSPLEAYPIDTARLAHVTRKAAEMAGWGRQLPKGHGLGIATHRSFVSYVSTVVEVKVSDSGELKIIGVWSAMDAGTVVNPGHASAQMEGGTLYGLSNALYGEITAKNGVVQQSNFPAWRVMRMHESPPMMKTHIVESDAPPGGVGEPPTPPAAPALTNAIYAASGLRIRRLPIFPAGGGDKLAVNKQQANTIDTSNVSETGV
ncbi:molybdopterin cofactor-binding domain-containing protein [Marinicella sp. W31]|uniref:xanthine dehydrogenase family protein molybdopterin-binding subunit n=1 Tax=Marinicella sp. W31 TaxID=3023713 RepID=UPI003756B652